MAAELRKRLFVAAGLNPLKREHRTMRSTAFFLILGSLTGLPTAVQPQPAPSAYQDGGEIYVALEHPDTRIEIGGSVIDVTFADGAPGLQREPVLAWRQRCSSTARMVPKSAAPQL